MFLIWTNTFCNSQILFITGKRRVGGGGEKGNIQPNYSAKTNCQQTLKTISRQNKLSANLKKTISENYVKEENASD